MRLDAAEPISNQIPARDTEWLWARSLQCISTRCTDKAKGYSQVDILLRQAPEGIGGDAVEPHVISHLAAQQAKGDNVSSGLIITQNEFRRRAKVLTDQSFFFFFLKGADLHDDVRCQGGDG